LVATGCSSPPVVKRSEARHGFFHFQSLFFEEKQTMLRKLFRNKKGQGLVEYGLIIAGVALICAAAISVFGHKTSDLISAVTAVLPGAHADDNGPLVSGKLIETTGADTGSISLDVATIVTNTDTGRLDANVLGTDGSTDGFGGLILEP
jgi:Flp pilus assembly pilin Flp